MQSNNKTKVVIDFTYSIAVEYDDAEDGSLPTEYFMDQILADTVESISNNIVDPWSINKYEAGITVTNPEKKTFQCNINYTNPLLQLEDRNTVYKKMEKNMADYLDNVTEEQFQIDLQEYGFEAIGKFK